MPSASAQTLLSEGEAILSAQKNSPFLKAADLEIKKQKQLQGQSFNLRNPDITIESPSATYMTVGVLQSFEFPSVYVKQGRLAKENTMLAVKGLEISEAELKKNIQSVYLNWQYIVEKLSLLKTQDSLYQKISEAAAKQFENGQIDILQKYFSESQYGEIHTQFIQLQHDAQVSLQQIQMYTGKTEALIPYPITKRKSAEFLETEISSAGNFPLVAYARQKIAVSTQSWQLEKHKIIPGFSFGYLNQGPKTTEFPLRLRGGINIPLWFWQYRAGIKAAKTELRVVEQNAIAQEQGIILKLQETQSDLNKYSSTLNYYEKEGLQRAENLISTAARMYIAGELDYVAYLRTLSDGYTIRFRHLETLFQFNHSLITLQYLYGQ